MKSFSQLIAEKAKNITELMPWDLEVKLNSDSPPMLLDIREQYEFDVMHIADSLLVPRGILETACDYDYDETIPQLAAAREREIVIICRSGNRSVMAADTMQTMGYQKISSLKTGLRGWNDYDQPLINNENEAVNPDDAEEFLRTDLRDDQKAPK